ncbi:hypothetical protein Tco_1471110 [Tanacetum coccineum]
MVLTTTSLTGFSGETIWSLGQLRLLVTIGDAYHSTKAWMNFMIARSLSPYNDIIGRPRIRDIQAVLFTTHRMLKFPANGGIVTIRSAILIPAECTTVITSSKEKKRGQAPERAKAIQAEVQKLVEAGIMREVYYHYWLSNPVMTGKSNLSAATPLSVSWTLTKATTRYRWRSQAKKKRPFIPAMVYIAIQKCPSASRTLAPHTNDWWTKLPIAKLVGTWKYMLMT